MKTNLHGEIVQKSCVLVTLCKCVQEWTWLILKSWRAWNISLRMLSAGMHPCRLAWEKFRTEEVVLVEPTIVVRVAKLTMQISDNNYFSNIGRVVCIFILFFVFQVTPWVSLEIRLPIWVSVWVKVQMIACLNFLSRSSNRRWTLIKIIAPVSKNNSWYLWLVPYFPPKLLIACTMCKI